MCKRSESLAVFSAGRRGVAYEVHPRHADLLIQALGPSAPLRTTPGLKPTSGAPGDQSPPSWAEARLQRTCAVRANYVALDRVGVAFAAKELCRRVSSPVWADLGPVPRGSTPVSLAFRVAAGGGTSRPCGCGVRRVPCDPTIDVRWHDIPGSAHHQALGGRAEARDPVVSRSSAWRCCEGWHGGTGSAVLGLERGPASERHLAVGQL